MADQPQPKTSEEIIAELTAKLKQVTEESDAKDSIIETQDEQLKAANAQGASALSVVTYKKQQYQVLAGKFSIDDKVVQHHELKANPDLVKKLVEEKSPLLQLIEEAKA
jgi:Holliday junction resolvasome RuvABC DNA-binding subunit